ncbi:AhpC/TSA family protein [Sinomicrobium kalidii]|uniref:TlpA disulfide reductase family protein n=1 Tax=Sinomicrobium kalidii TaxID=2900738 RepID=UPI001E451A85|nr:TlpA disulfide reductase family protein [Sinomicrobium kalidii]UGU14728.1 AhpC/TSA family protein [Sinomicrobium kalidii]
MNCVIRILSIVIPAFLLGCNPEKEKLPENTFRIKGHIKGVENGTVKITSRDMETRNSITFDSAQITGGSFTLEGPLTSPRELNLMIPKGGVTYYAGIMSDKSVMELRLDTAGYERKMNNYVSLTPEVRGSAFHEEYRSYEALIKPFRDRISVISESYNKLNELYIAARKKEDKEAADKYKEELEELKLKMEPFREQMDSVTDKYIAGHPGSYVSAYLMSMKVAGYGLEKSTVIYDQMPPEIQGGFYGTSVKKQLEKLKKASPGAEAALFTATDINGEELKLEDYRGQYVLLDFWASWCVPCRKGNPHLLKIYEKYRGKGFEIIGISDDDSNPEAWHKAVEEDGIGVWKHVLRGLKVDRSEGYKVLDKGISENYDIHFLPTKILIDPKGIIIGRYGSEEEPLDAKLEEVFGE